MRTTQEGGTNVATVIRKRSTGQSYGHFIRIIFVIFAAAALATTTRTVKMAFSTLFEKTRDPTYGEPAKVKATKGFARHIKSFVSGGFGGVCVVIVGHPLDLIKVQLQTSQTTDASMIQTMSRVINENGFSGLYRGVASPLLAAAFVFAVSFWGYDTGQQLIRYFSNHETLSIVELCLAGAFSGIPSALVLAPFERLKVLMQTDSSYTSMIHCGMDVVRKGGVSNLFRGTILTLLRDVPGSFAWYGTYEYMMNSAVLRFGYASPSELPSIVILVSGGFAGMVCWTISMPADLLKTKLQSAPDGTYAGLVDLYHKVTHEEGFSVLFKGLVPSLIRAFPANAACFFGMEVSKKALDYVGSTFFS